jgi:hypothetical protein
VFVLQDFDIYIASMAHIYILAADASRTNELPTYEAEPDQPCNPPVRAEIVLNLLRHN